MARPSRPCARAGRPCHSASLTSTILSYLFEGLDCFLADLPGFAACFLPAFSGSFGTGAGDTGAGRLDFACFAARNTRVIACTARGTTRLTACIVFTACGRVFVAHSISWITFWIF